MEERLARERNTGLNTTGMRTWGLIFLVLAAAGKALLQNRLLNVNGSTDLIAVLNAEGGMLIATIALMLQTIEGCAIPVFACLTVEGAVHTGDFKKYLARVAALAVLTEICYNVAMSGKIFALSDRNPVFGVVLALILIWFYKRYENKSLANILLKVMVTAAALVWALMLRVQHGAAFVAVTAALWAFRNKPNLRNLAGGGAMMLCCLISPFYMMAPLGFMIPHFYNGEKGSSSREFHYLVYPASLLIIGLIGKFL